MKLITIKNILKDCGYAYDASVLWSIDDVNEHMESEVNDALRNGKLIKFNTLTDEDKLVLLNDAIENVCGGFIKDVNNEIVTLLQEEIRYEEKISEESPITVKLRDLKVELMKQYATLVENHAPFHFLKDENGDPQDLAETTVYELMDKGVDFHLLPTLEYRSGSDGSVNDIHVVSVDKEGLITCIFHDGNEYKSEFNIVKLESLASIEDIGTLINDMRSL